MGQYAPISTLKGRIRVGKVNNSVIKWWYHAYHAELEDFDGVWHDVCRSNPQYKEHQIPKLNVSCLVLHLSLPNPLKPRVKSWMKM